MPRVALLIDSLAVGGAERVFSHLASGLAERDQDIHIICISKAPGYKLPDHIKVHYLTSQENNRSRLVKIVSLPLIVLRLFLFIRSHQINVVQSHLMASSVVNLLCRRFTHYRAQVVHTGQMGYGYSKIKTFFVRHLMRWLYTKVDAVVCKSEGMRHHLLKWFDGLEVPCIKIHNPINIQYIQQQVDQSEGCLNERRLHNSAGFKIIMVGRLIASKRHRDMIEALAYFDQPAQLIIIGDGPLMHELKSMVSVLQLDNKVQFVGHLDNPFAYMSQADVFVSCSESEGFPNVLVEAMACGVPVIAADCMAGPREILAQQNDYSTVLNEAVYDVNGMRYPVGDVNQLLVLLKRCYEDPRLRQHYSAQGLIKVNDYALDVILEHYSALLKGEMV